MPALDSTDALLLAVALVAAVVNGGIGYGFSSITVPVALLFHTNRVINPALVALEVGVNLAALVVNRRALPRVWQTVRPLLVGAVPGVAFGAWALRTGSPELLKIATYALLLPLIVLQSAGFRRPLRAGAGVGVGLGAGVGALYAATTVSGPPLALLLNNEGLTKEDFRAALSAFRVVESVLTALIYFALGLFTRESLALSFSLGPAVLVGLPLGFWLLRAVPPETFRRLCMVIDALVVSYGLARTAAAQGLVPTHVGYAVMAFVMAIEAVLVYRYLRPRRTTAVGVRGRALDFPIALRLERALVLVVGAGKVAEGRVLQLLDAAAKVHVVAPEATPNLVALSESGALRWSPRAFRPDDCDEARVVFTTTDQPVVNAAVVKEARVRGILANAADQPELCDFHVPSIGRQGPITIAVSTAGLAPGLAQYVRRRVLRDVGREYAVLARLIGRLRRRLPAGGERAHALRTLLEGGAAELIRKQDHAGLAVLLETIRPPAASAVGHRFTGEGS